MCLQQMPKASNAMRLATCSTPATAYIESLGQVRFTVWKIHTSNTLVHDIIVSCHVSFRLEKVHLNLTSYIMMRLHKMTST